VLRKCVGKAFLAVAEWAALPPADSPFLRFTISSFALLLDASSLLLRDSSASLSFPLIGAVDAVDHFQLKRKVHLFVET
jgi:hypothetical protein